MTDSLALGLILGLAAGLSPGPLLFLVVAETLRHGMPAGIKVALSPLITDLPIVLVTVLTLTQLSDAQPLLGLISLLGGCFLLSLGYESLRTQGLRVGLRDDQPRSLSKGILTNVLSPHPYLFWISVGAPILTQSMAMGLGPPLMFLLGFYGLLVGSKVLLALMVGRAEDVLTGPWYRYSLRLLGLILCGLALLFFWDGLVLLQINLPVR